ncbi:unnamed protein product [Adineta steineri]|uniref:Uncharacterized protein n=1 Tax=Adineta steineri TaxID=433720 RepID=A0A814D9S6_9BILA|nr:unnamed protein product [Adineta steineri]CAF4095263.1 unnamed protein product [Adineta steineri]
MRFLTGTLLIFIVLCCHQATATVSPIVISKVIEYGEVTCPSWITVLYTVTTRSKVACVSLGLQNVFCQTIQYNGHNKECILIMDRISSNMKFFSNPNLLIINLNRDPCTGLQTITFDDIPNISPTDNAIPTSYACFNWINGWYANTTTNSFVNTGYLTVLTSGQYVALNRNGTTLTINLTDKLFDIVSYFAAAAYTNSLQMIIQGSRNNTLINTTSITLNTSTRFLVQLNWTNIDNITISSSPSGLGNQFAIDNLVVIFS